MNRRHLRHHLRRHLRHAPHALHLAVISALLLAACTGGASPGSSSPPASDSAEPSATATASAPSSAAPSAEPSADASAEPTDDLGPFGCDFPVDAVGSTDRAQLTDVRVGEHDGFDRVVFEFAGGIPEFRLAEATPPFTQDASGLPLEVEGAYFWQLRLNGGTKVSPEGGVTYDGPTEFEPGFGKLVHLIEGGDFEAVSTWYVGMSSESCVRVLLLSAAPRLVIDIEH